MAILLLTLLVLGLAACSPELHALICADAGQSDDACAVKQYQSGMLEIPQVQAVDVSVILGVAIAASLAERLPLASPLFRLSPSRAPPFSLPPC